MTTHSEWKEQMHARLRQLRDACWHLPEFVGEPTRERVCALFGEVEMAAPDDRGRVSAIITEAEKAIFSLVGE